MALLRSEPVILGSVAPAFSLPGTDGHVYTLRDFEDAEALVVAFICNHCPYVKAIQSRLVALTRDYAERGVALVAISSNDATRYPDDSFERMKEVAQDHRYNFPYLYDNTQDIAKAYGAVCTPDFFIYDADRHLAYRGRLDDNWKDPAAVSQRDLRDALDALLAGERPAEPQHPSMGCSIKWAY